SDYDLLALMRVMTEEMRHGWQMSYLLCSHFGDEGKREAAKLLERRADEGERLLGSFNELVDNWLDFFTYTQFIDRDGKFQLTMSIPGRGRWLRKPYTKVIRRIGVHAHEGDSVDSQPIAGRDKYGAYLEAVLPLPERYQAVHDIEKDPGWIEARKADSLLK